jgi:hypothetical protein
MDQLIFFSVPGLVMALTVFIIRPSIVNSREELAALALLTPLVGYIIHQTYRWVFEWGQGFGRNSREVVSYIYEKLAPSESLLISREEAFLVWEVAIYDTQKFSGFLQHDGRSFHFTLAFWSTTFASIIGVFTTAVWFSFFQNIYYFLTPINIFLTYFQIFLAVIFYLRGKNVYKSINKQEVAFLIKNKEEFIKCMYKILDKPLPIKYVSEVVNNVSVHVSSARNDSPKVK